jgi:alpha-beta hydrolase superfamily lysophospholipase
VRELRFEVEGESVAGKLYEPSGPAKGQVVLVHGLLSQAAEFGVLPTTLAGKGWRVLGLDQRGFGASGGPRGLITQERATTDVLAAVAQLRRDAPALPVGLVGHSMGAVFALSAMTKDPTIKAAVLGAPMQTVRAEINAGEYAMYRTLHAISRVTAKTPFGSVKVPYKYDYDRLFYDKEAAKRAWETPFLHPTVDLTNVPAFLSMDSAKEAARVKQPVLVLLGEYDRAVKRRNSMAVYERLGGPKELVTLKCGHSMWADRESAAAVEHVDRWMTRHLGRSTV